MSKEAGKPDVKIDRTIETLRRRLRNLNEPFIRAVILFGSKAREEDDKKSDIDLLVLHEGCKVKDIVDRRRKIYCVLKENIGESFEDITVIDMKLKDFIKPREITPLLLNIYWDAKIVYDQTEKLEEFLKHIRRRIRECGLKRVKDGKAYYWTLPEPLKEVKII